MNTVAMNTIAEWRAKEGQLETVLRLLAEVAMKSKEEEGNLFYTVYQSFIEPNTLYLIEGYTDATALDTHRNSDYFKQILVGQIVPLLEARTVNQVRELDLRDFVLGK
ncbi:putative quinol monooxygenase [Spirosoma jeollabukense]